MSIEKFINEQLNERYKHFIIYGPPKIGKTKLGKRIAALMNGKYLDLLALFLANDNFAAQIDVFGPQRLIELIQNEVASFIVIDQLDFLLNTWDDTQFRELMVYVDQNQSKTCCALIMHNYRLLEKEDMIKPNDKGHERLLNIYNIQ